MFIELRDEYDNMPDTAGTCEYNDVTIIAGLGLRLLVVPYPRNVKPPVRGRLFCCRRGR